MNFTFSPFFSAKKKNSTVTWLKFAKRTLKITKERSTHCTTFFCTLPAAERENCVMGKNGKKQKNQQRRGKRVTYNSEEDEEQQNYPLSPLPSDDEYQSTEEQEEDDENNQNPSNDNVPSKFSLYQQSVQVTHQLLLPKSSKILLSELIIIHFCLKYIDL